MQLQPVLEEYKLTTDELTIHENCHQDNCHHDLNVHHDNIQYSFHGTTLNCDDEFDDITVDSNIVGDSVSSSCSPPLSLQDFSNEVWWARVWLGSDPNWLVD